MATNYFGKTVIITGAGAGIGAAISRRMAKLGAIVYVTDINGTNAGIVAQSIVQEGGQAVPMQLDVTDKSAIQHVIDEVLRTHAHLDFMFNNAGIAIGGDALDIGFEQWEKVMNVNFQGVLYGSLLAYQVMAEQRSGHIINTASGTGLMPQPGNTPYCTSKFGVVGFSLSLRYEAYDNGVSVSVVCPGHVQTDIYKNMEVVNVANEKVVASLPVKAMDTQKAAEIILDGVGKHKEIIIFPNNVKWAWRIYRWFPGLLNNAWLEKIRNIRRLKSDS